MSLFVSILVAVVLVLLAVSMLLAYRAILRRRLARLLRIESPNGVDESLFVELGGLPQWVNIRGEDRNRPVLLVLHGGPGTPYSVLTPKLRSWERDFVVVQWDRRGAGKTFGLHGKEGSGPMTYARMLDDAIELSTWLLAKLGQSKLVVLSSSAGTPLGLALAKQRPDLVAALVATDVNVGMLHDAKLKHHELVTWAREHGKSERVRALESMGADPRAWTAQQFDLRMRWTEPLVPKNERLSSLFLPAFLTSPRHTLKDVMALVHGLQFSTEALLSEMTTFDAYSLGSRFEVPVFIFQGARDIFTKPDAVAQYARYIEAPTKHFELLPGAGHLGAFRNADKFL